MCEGSGNLVTVVKGLSDQSGCWGRSISLGVVGFYANTEHFSGFGAVVASPAECPEGGGGMWGIFGEPLKRATWNTWVCMLY